VPNPKNNDLKRRVRARMKATGENWTTARHAILNASPAGVKSDAAQLLRCHHCGSTAAAYQHCPGCGGRTFPDMDLPIGANVDAAGLYVVASAALDALCDPYAGDYEDLKVAHTAVVAQFEVMDFLDVAERDLPAHMADRIGHEALTRFAAGPLTGKLIGARSALIAARDQIPRAALEMGVDAYTRRIDALADALAAGTVDAGSQDPPVDAQRSATVRRTTTVALNVLSDSDGYLEVYRDLRAQDWRTVQLCESGQDGAPLSVAQCRAMIAFATGPLRAALARIMDVLLDCARRDISPKGGWDRDQDIADTSSALAAIDALITDNDPRDVM
jgi:hypothetical protein